MKATDNKEPDIYRFSLQCPNRIFDGMFVRLSDYQRQSDLLEACLDACKELRDCLTEAIENNEIISAKTVDKADRLARFAIAKEKGEV